MASPLQKSVVGNVLDRYFAKHGLVQMQIDSYNNFLQNAVQKIAEETPPIRFNCKPQVDDNLPSNNTGDPDAAPPPLVYEFEFGSVEVERPCIIEKNHEKHYILPMDARLRDLTYDCSLYMTIHQRKPIERVHERIFIGKVPCMVGSFFCNLWQADAVESQECMYDKHGYFIINGKERGVICQEAMCPNRVFVFRRGNFREGVEAEVRSEKVTAKPPSVTKVVVATHRIEVLMPLTKPVPLHVVFAALGVTSPAQAMRMVNPDPLDEAVVSLVKPALEKVGQISQDEAYELLGKRSKNTYVTSDKRHDQGRRVVERELFPHMGLDDHGDTRTMKGYFLGYMIRKAIQVGLGRLAVDDRDHFGNKRIEAPGALLASLFRQKFGKMFRDFKRDLGKALFAGKCHRIDLSDYIDTKTVTKHIKYAFSTGTWGTNKTGVSQVVNRTSYINNLSMMRRMSMASGQDNKMTGPRQLHGTQMFTACNAETPEGEQCGLVKNLALSTIVTVDTPDTAVKEALSELGVVMGFDDPADTRVFVNGCLVGSITTDHRAEYHLDKLIYVMRDLRAALQFSSEMSIVHVTQANEVHFNTDAGRVCRPLFVVRPHNSGEPKDQSGAVGPESGGDDDRPLFSLPTKKYKSWEKLVEDRVVEFLDVDEQETAYIAMWPEDVGPEHTHCEIHPSMILGVCGSLIPFPDHNQSPRNTYQAAMSKQAIGVSCTNYAIRMDSIMHVLHYPQVAAVNPYSARYLDAQDLPSGQNVVVAVNTYTGYNQEDSLIMNQSAIDRGLFTSTVFKTFNDEERSSDNKKEQFSRPDPSACASIKGGSYAAIDEDGLPRIGARLRGGDIVIGKTATLPPRHSTDASGGKRSRRQQQHGHDQTRLRDVSTTIKIGEECVVDKVVVTTNEAGNRLAKVRTRAVRRPRVGDKFSSRHGQKGTVGATYRQEDMPFNPVTGMVPDIIINPHCLPSRMTVGQLYESLLGKSAVMEGNLGDGTPFEEVPLDDIYASLQSHGLQRLGNETLYCGRTGVPIRAQIFTGPVFYQRLKHMVVDKFHSRARGQVQVLSRQPSQGRAKDGGLRFGEMERDCMLSHGSAMVLKERLCDQSDPYRVHVCVQCGMIANVDFDTHVYECKSCDRHTGIVQVYIPYATKLLIQEMISMGIAVRIKTKK